MLGIVDGWVLISEGNEGDVSEETMHVLDRRFKTGLLISSKFGQLGGMEILAHWDSRASQSYGSLKLTVARVLAQYEGLLDKAQLSRATVVTVLHDREGSLSPLLLDVSNTLTVQSFSKI